MEQIYTIPVNEAFDECVADPKKGCPFCMLYRKLQNDELDIILGASMMEPDIRKSTNEYGFCHNHYSMMMRRKRMLGIGLMMESHLAEVEKKLNGPVISPNKAKAVVTALSSLECSCYVCQRINKNLSMMISTAVYLWESDVHFPKKYSKVKYFCLPHYRAMIDYAEKKSPKKIFRDFYDVTSSIQKKYLKELSGDVSWFCKKFDYRYDEEPWYNAKDALPRTEKFLSGDLGYEE